MFRRRDEVLKFLAGRVDGIELKGKRGNDLRRRKGEERRGKKERREGKIGEPSGWKRRRKERNGRKGDVEGARRTGERVKKRGKGRREDDVGYEKGECRVAKVTPAL